MLNWHFVDTLHSNQYKNVESLQELLEVNLLLKI